VVVPNGVDTTYFSPARDVATIAGRVVFVGANTFPNRDAVDYLRRDVWRSVRRSCPTASLHLVGACAPRAAVDHAGSDITALGHVADIRPHLARAACCVAPLRVGGGTRLKILDAWAMGIAVVSTSLGCEGLDVIDGENIIVRDDPESFAAAVAEVLRSPTLRARLGANGRATVEQFYGWDAVGRRLRDAYWDVLSACPVRRLVDVAG
jgi:glycosyltransferase involved in cell wall biosynthesis